jgi:hypothetical protein
MVMTFHPVDFQLARTADLLGQARVKKDQPEIEPTLLNQTFNCFAGISSSEKKHLDKTTTKLRTV